MVLSGIYRKGCWIKCHADNNIKNKEKEKLLKFPFQTEEVLSKDSAEDLNKGLNPGPMTEIKFWEAKVGGFGSTWV